MHRLILNPKSRPDSRGITRDLRTGPGGVEFRTVSWQRATVVFIYNVVLETICNKTVFATVEKDKICPRKDRIEAVCGKIVDVAEVVVPAL